MLTDEILHGRLSSRLDEPIDKHIWETVIERLGKIEEWQTGISDKITVIERTRVNSELNRNQLTTPIEESEMLLVSELDRKLKVFEEEIQ
jgi:hypothetical protein